MAPLHQRHPASVVSPLSHAHETISEPPAACHDPEVGDHDVDLIDQEAPLKLNALKGTLEFMERRPPLTLSKAFGKCLRWATTRSQHGPRRVPTSEFPDVVSIERFKTWAETDFSPAVMADLMEPDAAWADHRTPAGVRLDEEGLNALLEYDALNEAAMFSTIGGQVAVPGVLLFCGLLDEDGRGQFSRFCLDQGVAELKQYLSFRADDTKSQLEEAEAEEHVLRQRNVTLRELATLLDDLSLDSHEQLTASMNHFAKLRQLRAEWDWAGPCDEVLPIMVSTMGILQGGVVSPIRAVHVADAAVFA